MKAPLKHDQRLARTLILDELFDLSLYRALRRLTTGRSAQVLDRLIQTEQEHFAFWQKFFDVSITELNLGRRLKLRLLTMVGRLLGNPGIHLVLEAIEVYGVRKYLTLWESYKDKPFGEALQGVLVDEFSHEDALVTDLTERTINPEKVRNIFLGFNDGLVEILGAVSGFFGAFGEAKMVLIAAATTAMAGSLSMGAGAFAALNSEQEIQQTDAAKKRFLKLDAAATEMEESPVRSGFLVGGSYLAGAMVPVLPVFFGATNVFTSLMAAGTMIILVSSVLAFLSGMNIRRRILLNVVIIAAAVSITYVIGMIARQLWGISVT
jgi:VIT1/CCC1 family predicted Fe2+/Mn2+ transporter